ncbi:hypothetical protein D1872_183490 [compost metagenome]
MKITLSIFWRKQPLTAVQYNCIRRFRIKNPNRNPLRARCNAHSVRSVFLRADHRSHRVRTMGIGFLIDRKRRMTMRIVPAQLGIHDIACRVQTPPFAMKGRMCIIYTCIQIGNHDSGSVDSFFPHLWCVNMGYVPFHRRWVYSVLTCIARLSRCFAIVLLQLYSFLYRCRLRRCCCRCCSCFSRFGICSLCLLVNCHLLQITRFIR